MNYGARHYQQTSDNTASPRAIEIAVLRETNKRLSQAADTVSRVAALNRNHRMWSTLVKDVGLSSNPLPPVLKSDLLAIGAFSMDYSTVAITRPLPLTPLIEINEQMIEGLSLQVTQRPVLQACAGLTELGNVLA